MTDGTDELRARVEAKRHELQAQLKQAEADARAEKNEEADTLRAKLAELDETLKEGWENLSDATVAKLNEWMR